MRLSFFIVSVVAMACGGAVTSVDGNKNTSTLTPPDQNQLCTDTYNYVKNSLSTSDMAKLACGFSVTNTDPSTCQNDYNACVTKEIAAGVTPANGPLDCTAFDQSLAKCNTTVAEYTKCLTQEMDAMRSMEAQFPLCTQAAAQTAEIDALSKISADCMQLLQTCQMAFAPTGGSSGSDGGGPLDGG